MKGALRSAVIALAACMLASSALSDGSAPERVIHLKGTTNTRDIGGYPTADGRAIRWRQIIRSDYLARLTPAGFQTLEELGVKTVVDLRTVRENEKAPTVWLGEHPPQIFHFPIGDSHNAWFNAQRKMMKKNNFTEEEAVAHVIAGYGMIAEEGPPSLRNLMELVREPSNWPILIHCSAGKDRAGVAAALILEAVGVDRDTIMQDYLLSNEVGRAEEKAALLSSESKRTRTGSKLGRGPSPGAWFPFVGVQPDMLQEFYSSVDEQYGSMDAFLTDLGVDQEARKSLAAALTEPADPKPSIDSKQNLEGDG